MDSKLLIDAIVHQTTVLIAQLSTAAGIRAPLAHVADQVFLELSREIEAQGVSRKVAADMFGLAIRTYQKKVQRLTESVTTRERTLWEAVLDHLNEGGAASRREVLERFHRDDPVVVGSVLSDLVSSGLVYRTGAADCAVFGVTDKPDLDRTLRERRRTELPPILWVWIFRSGGLSIKALREQFPGDDQALSEALAQLEADGQVQSQGEGENTQYQANTFLVPVGSERGWEAAVFDHFQAVARAIACKVQQGVARSMPDDVVGGATLTFDIHPHHPNRQEVLGLLKRIRGEVNELWSRVQDYNVEHPIADEERTGVSFYFGQAVTEPEGEAGKE